MFSWLKRKKPFRIIGLTGGVGSGKTLVAAYFEKVGIPVINLDSLGRELSDSSADIIQQVEKHFGAEAIKDGKLNRAHLRQVIFTHPDYRLLLESILHPIIWSEFHRRVDALKSQGHSLVICEAALLIESGHFRDLDGLIVVDAPADLRLARVQQRDGISKELAARMMEAQVGDGVRRDSADYLIVNDSDVAALEEKTKNLVEKLR